MARVQFTTRELVVFALDLMEKQLAEGLIDEEHMPPLRLKDADCEVELKELTHKIGKTATIPHPDDIMNATSSFYNDQEKFAEMVSILMERAAATAEVKSTMH